MNQNEKEHILIVDDRAEYLWALEKRLKSPHLNIITATSGSEALDLMPGHDFALIIMDVMMPVMDGIETAERIRKNPGTDHIPIIFVTGIERNRERVFKGYEAGAVDYLFKPLNMDILKSKVNIFLDLHRQKKALEKVNRELVEKNELINLQKNQLLETLSRLENSYEDLKKSQEQVVELERQNAIMAMAVTANHELNQPLTVLGGYIEMFQETMDPAALSGKQGKFIKKIKESFEQINCILNKFNKAKAVKLEDYIGDQKIVVFEDFPGKKKNSTG
jgi:two-component system cell cycle response regulator